MVGATKRFTSPSATPTGIDDAAFAAYMAAFTMADVTTGAAVVAAFDAARVDYLAAVRTADPFGCERRAACSVVRRLRRPTRECAPLPRAQVEEMARHASHADIIREESDGVQVPYIQLSQEGMGANEFFQPYVPAPGTVGGDDHR
jgi:hypothetical protein